MCVEFHILGPILNGATTSSYVYSRSKGVQIVYFLAFYKLQCKYSISIKHYLMKKMVIYFEILLQLLEFN